ncbi:MAG: hypothetical protein IJY49_01340 [Clostridia bacterium]|nr:hypothetical protein [Clostridia bacterium]
MKNKKIMIIALVVLLVGAVAVATGLTAAYWVGAEGDSEIAPQTDTTDWNYWSKYFIYEAIKENNNTVGYKIVGFEGAVLENVIIPRIARGGRLKNADGTYSEIVDSALVKIVGNSIFANTTDKAIPTSITLPTTVAVEPGAFIGLVNLISIKVVSVLGEDNVIYDNSIEIGTMAFFGCDKVERFIAATDIQFTTDANASGMSFDALKTATGLPADLTRSAS